MARLLLTMVLVASVAVELGSETLTMTTTYPSPAGIYRTMVTTDKTYLARDQNGSAVSVGSASQTTPSTLTVYGITTFKSGVNFAGGNVGIGTSTPATLLQVGGGGSGKLSVNSRDNNYGQLQIGNPANWAAQHANTSEASIGFISGATSFGSTPTSMADTSHVWDMGVDNYGNYDGTFGFGNQAHGLVLGITPAGCIVFSDGSTQCQAAAASTPPTPVSCTWNLSSKVISSSYDGAGVTCSSGYPISVSCFNWGNGAPDLSYSTSVYPNGNGAGIAAWCIWNQSADATHRIYQALALCCTGINVTNPYPY